MDVTFGEGMFIGGCLIAIVMFITWKAKEIIARKKVRASIPSGGRDQTENEGQGKRDSDSDFSQ